MIAEDELEKRVFLLKKQIKENPESKDSWGEMGLALFQKGDHEGALSCLDKAIAIDPKHSESWNTKGDILFRMGRIEESEKSFREALRLNPENQNALYNMGVSKVKDADPEGALGFFEKILEINPNHDFAAMWRIRLIKSIRNGERKVWIFVGSSDSWKRRKGDMTSWGIHDNSSDVSLFRKVAKGDIVLAYRRSPNNDIFSVHIVDSWPYIDRSTAWSHRTELREYMVFDKPISLSKAPPKDSGGKKKRRRLVEILISSLEGMGEKTIFELNPKIWNKIKEDLLQEYPEYLDSLVSLTETHPDSSLFYHMDIEAIRSRVTVREETLMQLLTAIKSGRNVVLFGPPRSGKKELLDAVLAQICGRSYDAEGLKMDNYTKEIGDPDWGLEDVFGGWHRDGKEKVWNNGFFTHALEMCISSSKTTGKPHYLFVQNIETVLENMSFIQALDSTLHKGEQPFASKRIPSKVRPPSEFRMVATMDTDATELSPYFGKVRKYFSPVEMEMPETGEEYESIPRMVRQRLTGMGIMAADELEAKTISLQGGFALSSPFDGDVDGSILNAYRLLMAFVKEDAVPPEDKKKACGIRTYRDIGNQILVDIMMNVVNTFEGYPRESALEDSIVSELLPALHDLSINAMGNIMMKAIELFGLESKVANAMDRMIWGKGPNPTMRIEMGKNAKNPFSSDPEERAKQEARERERNELEKKKQEARERELKELEKKKKEILEEKRREKEKQKIVDANKVPVDYSIDMDKIFLELSIHKNVVNQVMANIESGRNVILFGPPGCGKTKLATLLGEQLCGRIRVGDAERPNYTILTANAEWDNYEMVGGISPIVDDVTDQVVYRFKDGFVTETVRKCIDSLMEREKPHYLIIDEFNRANIDEAFGKLFTVFEYRDEQPLLSETENRGVELRIPKQYRIIGTMNAQDKNTLFDLGYALMRRFAFIEVTLPDKEDEYKRMGQFVQLRMRANLSSEVEPVIFSPKLKGKMFPNDPEDIVFGEYKKLMKFVEEESLPDEGEEVARGVRTYRQIGTSQIIDCVVTALNAPRGYSVQEAMEDAIISNVLPQLENLEKSQISNMHLKAVEVFGARSRVAMALEKMVKNPLLSIFG